MDVLFHTREFNRNYHKGQYLLAGFRISPLPYFLIQAKLVGMNLDSEIKVGASADAPVDVKEDKELEEMFRAGVHFAYSRSRRHPKMSPFIYGIKSNVEIFDLENVRVSLRKAEDFLKNLGESKKPVLWVGTKPSVRNFISGIAKDLSHPFITERWLGGILTNAKVIKERLRYFEDLKAKQASGELEKYTKREKLEILREIQDLSRYLSGLENIKNEIFAIVIVDPKEEKTAFLEALKVKLPVVAILSSDNDLTKVAYPIPANDSSPSSVGYLLERLARAWKEGSTLANNKTA